MNTIFMNSENSKTSKFYYAKFYFTKIYLRLLINDLREVKMFLLYQMLVFTIHGKT